MSERQLTRDDLIAHANEMCRKYWGIDYTGTIELVNRKWTRTNAKYIYKRGGQPAAIIQMSSRRNSERTTEQVLGSLLHELVHWRLHSLGLPASDRSPDFVRECERVGAPFSGAEYAQKAAKKYGGVA